MKITEALKAELAQWLDTYWKTYLKGDLDLWSTFIAEDYYNIGGTKEEIWHNKQEILNYSKTIYDQMVDQAEIRNRTIEVLPYGDYVMVNEFTDLYVKIEDQWSFYGPFRMSSLLAKTNTGWIALHQHGSYPDMKTTEGEAFAADALKAENKRLQEAVDQRTSELVLKNRELEIETSLEKVRSRSMAMHDTSELQEVIHTVHEELLKLDLGIFGGSFIVINSEIEKELRCWGSGGTANTSEEVHIPFFNKPFYTNLIKGIKSGPSFFTEEFTQKEKQEFFTFLFTKEPWSQLKDEEQKEILQSPGGYTRSVNVSHHTSIFIINQLGKKFSEEENDILKRFGTVFEQTYTRFLDLQKAEAQARKANIEVAVERVRAQSMAMHHPDDLDKVNKEILSQLKWLEIQGLSGVTFYLVEEDGWVKAWDFSSPGNIGDQTSYKFQFDFNRHEMLGFPFKTLLETDLDYFVADYPIEKLEKAVYEIEEIDPAVSRVFKEAISTGVLTHQWSACVRISNGMLGIDLVNSPDEDTKVIGLKMASAFNQAYTRFLDLQKAEAQARESQIEAALERVRSRSLAMHKSDELAETATVMFQQLRTLGVKTYSSGITLWENKGKEMVNWLCRPDGSMNPPFKLKTGGDPWHQQQYDSWKKGEDFRVKDLSGEEMKEHFKYLRTYPLLDEAFTKIVASGHPMPERQVHHVANFSHGNLLFITLQPNLEAHDIFKRFTIVFNQTYTRFLDLQKAEAQAREAEIELALERVRARTMAMQKSEELAETASLLFEQISNLGIQTWTSGFNIWEHEDASFMGYNPTPTGGITAPYRIPSTEDKFFKTILEAKRRGEDFLVFESKGKSLAATYQYMKTLPIVKDVLYGIEGAGIQLPTSQINHCVFFSYGFLLFITLEPHPDSHHIFQRFGKVFEQTYTRFLDLQKAEAQARESQIEAALERIRTQSMLMQHSGQLDETLGVFHEQVSKLGINSVFSFLWLPEEKNNQHFFWTAWPESNNNSTFFRRALNYPLDRNDPETARCLADWKSNKKVVSYYIPQSGLKNHFEGWKELTEGVDILKPENFSGGLHYYEAFMKYGCFGFMVENEMTEEVKKALYRIAVEFERTYTRFLDLQKAEAQAREAEIELALERVRAKSMAMHKSDELADLSFELVKQVQSLGVPTWFCAFNIYDEEEKGSLEWGSNAQGTYKSYRTPREGIFLRYYEAGQAGETLLINKIGEKECPAHYEYLCSLPGVGDQLLQMREAGIAFPTSQIDHVAFFKYGYIIFITYEPAPESHDVFKRFAKVFEQTYTRFLDLQKAEAQAREAQIEASLERIRGKVASMRESPELLDIVVTMRNEFVALGHEAHYFWHMRWLENTYEKAMTSGDGTRIGMVMELPRGFHEDPRMIAWEQTDDPIGIFPYDADGAIDYVDKMIQTGRFDLIDHNAPGPDDIRAIGGITFIMARTTHGEIGFSLPGPVPNPPQEDLNTLVRFARVFDLAYSRFEDLKNSEFQARETQIELALERVRSRSMGMQKSEELQEVIKIVYKQLIDLKIKLDHAGFVVDYTPRGDWHFWIADEQDIPSKITHPYFESVWANQFNEAKENGADYFVTNLDFEKKNKFYQELLTHVPDLPEEVRDFYLGCPGLAATTVLFENIALYIENFEGIAYTKEENKTLIRFGKVFQQTYTRFLDLQKAEAQTRIAQIDLAIERVRAKALAMHNSSQILEVVAELKNEMLGLEISGVAAATIYLDEEDGYIRMWDLTSVNETEDGFQVTLDVKFKLAETDPRFFVRRIWNNKAHYFVEKQDENDMAVTLEWLRQYNAEEADSVSQFFEANPLEYVLHPTVKLAHGKMSVDILNADPPAEMESILKKMGAAFDLAYKRFLDLKKAEAQAREAQIEVALERVRSRSLAMHTSAELAETATVLFQQLKSLGVDTYSSGITLWENDGKEMVNWLCRPDGSMNPPFKLTTAGDPWHQQQYESWRKKEVFIVKDLSGEEMQAHFKYLRTYPLLDDAFTKIVASGHPMPERQVHHAANFSHGNLLFICLQPNPDAHEIFIRFTKVFQQTYTRFLDLQRAEAQAREAKIEAALERVRSRTIGMQHSEELQESAALMFQQISSLDVSIMGCGFNIWDEDRKAATAWMSGMDRIQPPFKTDHTKDIFRRILGANQRGESLFVEAQKGKDLNAHYEYMASIPTFREILEGLEKKGLSTPSFQIMHCAFFSQGYLMFITHEACPDAYDIFLRFAKVFEQTYARFLDLQKAEAQARESEIQLALERVRARTMAMQHSEELQDAAIVLFEQVKALGFETGSCGFHIWEEGKKEATVWVTSPEGGMQKPFQLPHTESALYKAVLQASKSGEAYRHELSDDALIKHFDYLCTVPGIGDIIQNLRANGYEFPQLIIYQFAFFKQGYLSIHIHQERPDASQVFNRFAKVFQQTYTRFLDLQKAEAQAREAQIELGLERVRARAMAMQNSDELSDLVGTLLHELTKLDFSLTFCIINIYNESDQSNIVWAANPEEGKEPESYYMRFEDYPFHHAMMREWKAQTPKFVYIMEGEEKEIYDDYLYTETEFRRFPLEVQNANRALDKYVASFVFSPFGGLQTVGSEALSDENLDILYRFGKVFDLTYTRFNDLKKAEAQAREAQIEAALERVRAYTMSMNKSNDLRHTVSSIFKELDKLDLKTMRCAIGIINGADRTVNVWTTTATEDGDEVTFSGNESMDVHPLMQGVFESWKTQEDYYYTLEGEDLVEYYNTMGGDNYKLPEAASGAKVTVLDTHYYYCTFFPAGGIAFFKELPFAPDLVNVIRRFANAFSLAYKRFEDLKLSEAQAREAKIEAGLEKIRSRTMAMQQSDELPDAANVLFNEVRKLDIPAWSCGYNILSEDKKSSMCWMSSENEIQTPFRLPLTEHESMIPWHEAILSNEAFFVYEQGGEKLAEHYRYLGELPELKSVFAQFDAANISLPTFQVNHLARFDQGFLLFITYERVPEAHDIFKRFTRVFNQTYTRFLDLQKAEARARESQIETALERVRSRTMGMQQSEELGEVATVLFSELNGLVDDLWTCGFVLCEQDRSEDEWWLSMDTGFTRGFFLPNVGDFAHASLYEGWQKGEAFRSVTLEGEQLQEHYDWLMGVPIARQIFEEMDASGLERPTWQKLHAAYFKTGYLVIITAVPCAEEEIFKRFAQAFDLTYTRFLDLQQKEDQGRKLVEEKIRLEHTLKDLQATQAQLIQSEKMASLGELTAGIAHEIQNPLNFVNNFSEVSNELIDEIEEERVKKQESRDEGLVSEILADIKENLLKINHHGKRADAIVKGMLEHSRANKGEKLPSNLNALADEFVRLSYHGLRAKDKSFNADFTLDLDPDLPKVNVAAADIGRVILNLVNNAFYAVNEKAKSTPQPPIGIETYKPLVTVKTMVTKSPLGDLGVELSVQDNGLGIPKHIKEKIFQPFFTTKPTGSGTGLGLSLSYDIVKAHGGEIKVDSKEEEGSLFCFLIPINN